MDNELYISTGAFIGKKNQRDYRLAADSVEKFSCDGYELLLYSDWYNELDKIAAEYKKANVQVKIIHADKQIGDMFSSLEDDDINQALELFKINCGFAGKLGVDRIVAHIWGIPNSDTNAEDIYRRISDLLEIANEYKIELLLENIIGNDNSPLYHMKNIMELYPEIKFTIDTRCSQFHGELKETCEYLPLWENHVRHLHINDYEGDYKDWSSLYPILHPGEGDIDFEFFFSFLKSISYKYSLTLESPSILENGIDYKPLNKSLNFIREKLS